METRFNDYREITAKFASVDRSGNPIAKGDIIGYSRKFGTVAAPEWSKWSAENRAADEDERMMSGGRTDYSFDLGHEMSDGGGW